MIIFSSTREDGKKKGNVYFMMHSRHFIWCHTYDEGTLRQREKDPLLLLHELHFSVRERETIFTCPHTLKFQTRPLAGTASGMASDSVRGRGILVSSKVSFICTIPQTGYHIPQPLLLVLER